MARVLLVILGTLIIVSCTNKIEKARQLLDEDKQDEAISVLSTLKKDDKQYSEAQHLIKYAKSKNVFNDALKNYNNNDFENALEYFNKVEDAYYYTLYPIYPKNLQYAEIFINRKKYY